MNKNIKRIIALTLTINAFSAISAITPGVALNFITKPVYAASYSPSSEELKSLTVKSMGGDTLDLRDGYNGSTVKLNEDKEYYIKALFEGRLKKKIMLLVNTKSSMRPRITNLYPETNAIVKTMNISMFERLSIMLAKNGMFLVLDIFLFFHRYLIELIQIVKGRRSK